MQSDKVCPNGNLAKATNPRREISLYQPHLNTLEASITENVETKIIM